MVEYSAVFSRWLLRKKNIDCKLSEIYLTLRIRCGLSEINPFADYCFFFLLIFLPAIPDKD